MVSTNAAHWMVRDQREVKRGDGKGDGWKTKVSGTKYGLWFLAPFPLPSRRGTVIMRVALLLITALATWMMFVTVCANALQRMSIVARHKKEHRWIEWNAVVEMLQRGEGCLIVRRRGMFASDLVYFCVCASELSSEYDITVKAHCDGLLTNCPRRIRNVKSLVEHFPGCHVYETDALVVGYRRGGPA